MRRSAATTTKPKTVEFRVHFGVGDRGRRRLRTGSRPAPAPASPGRIPRIARLMALAIRYDDLIRQGVVRDFSDMARLGGVSRARMSQVMDLLNLAPEIQASLLSMPRMTAYCGVVTERQLRALVAIPDWDQQREMWTALPGGGQARHPA